MNKVLLIGAGNIGSRHLQGLKLVEYLLDILVVEPSAEAREKAQKRFNQVQTEKPFLGQLKFVETLPQDLHFDIVIVATHASLRRKVVEELMAFNSVKYLILEKFLFQSIEDYSVVEKLLDEKNVSAFVNCPRRLYPVYQEIRRQCLVGQEPMEFHFSGSDWGLACNSIHRLDLFFFLTGQKEIMLSTDFLENEIKRSKRAGNIEFHGRLEGHTERGDKLVITSFAAGNAPSIHAFTSLRARYIVQEKQGILMESKEDGDWEWKKTQFQPFFQSQLTNKVVEQLIEKGTCSLPDYQESSQHHKVFLATLLNYMSKLLNKKIEVCPVT